MEQKKIGYRPAEVAHELGIGITLARQLISSGQIRSIKLGRTVVVPRTELDVFIARQLATMATS